MKYQKQNLKKKSLTQSRPDPSPPYLIGGDESGKIKVNSITKHQNKNRLVQSLPNLSPSYLIRGGGLEGRSNSSASTVIPANKLFLIIILAIFLISSISALGVTPARNTLDFSSSLQTSGSFKILNSEGIARELVIQTRGELANNIVLEERRVNFESTDPEKSVNYKINLPQELSPGLHVAEIVISEPPKEAEGDNTVVGATLAVVTQVHVYVSYPGKYAEAKFNIKSGTKDEGIIFVLPTMNKGEFDIANAYANIDIYSSLNEKIDSFNTKSVSITSGQKVDLTHTWKKDVPVGDYKAVATIIYDGESITLEDIFKVGAETLELQQITVNNFQLGEIAKMELLIENKWSEIIDKVHSQVQIFSEAGDILADFNSPDYFIDPLSKKVLVSYWDTIGVQEATYDTKVTLHYSTDKSTDSDIQLVVKNDRIEVIGLGYVLSEKGGVSSGDGNNIVMILVIVIGVLILINILWFLVLRKFMSKKK